MRVELTEHFTDDSRGFLSLTGEADPKSVHSEKDSALNGFQTVAHIRKGPGDDNGHRIVDVRGTHLVVDFHGFNQTVIVLFELLNHIFLTIHICM